MENSNSKLVTILNSNFLHEIQFAQVKLEKEGIRSYIADENLNIIIGTAFIEGYRLQISSNDVIKANTILNKIEEWGPSNHCRLDIQIFE